VPWSVAALFLRSEYLSAFDQPAGAVGVRDAPSVELRCSRRRPNCRWQCDAFRFVSAFCNPEPPEANAALQEIARFLAAAVPPATGALQRERTNPVADQVRSVSRPP